MTAEMEFSGRNVKKAVQLAAETLGVPAENIDYDIVSHGSSGIFGLAGVKKARIKVRSNAQPPFADVIDLHRKERDREPKPQTAPGAESDAIQEARQIGESILRRMVDAISPESTISVENEAHDLRFMIEGGLSGVLIGKRGQTLEAMQLILEKAVGRLNGHDIRLQVDVEGYLAKKKAGLVHTAERMAKQVAAKGSPSSVGFLNARDRRVVHLALKDHNGVRTKSIGEGPVRKLMIYPKRGPRTKM
jgi:spoIIIJ-associated protein